MDFAAIQAKLIGQWVGTNVLHLSWMTPSEYSSVSELSIVPVVKGTFLTFAYTYEHEGEAQQGFLMLGYDAAQAVATAAWGDSWHMNNKVMLCQGSITEQGAIDLRGNYEAPPGPDWGWRIALTLPSDMELRLVMYNCTPEGEEELAVEANYRRVI